MFHYVAKLIVLALAAFAAGCTSTSPAPLVRAQSPSTDFAADKSTIQLDVEKKDDDTKEDDDQAGEPIVPPKTLFEWAILPKSEGEEEGEDSIVTDRPDFTEASSTVGLGRIQLEAGYTFYRDRTGSLKTNNVTYPEALLRVGAFTDWIELRFGQTYSRSDTRDNGEVVERLSGLDDLYVGTKLWLTEQNEHLPEMALILQATLPTGRSTLTADEILPGFNFLYGWDVISDCLTAAGSFGANRALDDESHAYVEITKSFTIGYSLTDRLGAYTEWFGFFPTSAIAPDVGPEHYFNGGFTFKVTPDLQLDIRAGRGVNERAQDFFAGAGFAVRY